MSFTKTWLSEWKGKTVIVYVSNKRNYYGILDDFGETYVKISGILFNPDHIISMSLKESKCKK